MPTAEDVRDDERTWHCKECGARQRSPDPPCERCWNTTFVSGDGAETVLADDGSESFGFTPAQAARVRTATTRSAALSATLAVCFGGVHEVFALTGTLEGVAFLGVVAAGGSAVVFLTAALVAAAAARWHDRLLA